ncbi:MAG: LysR family transcriptional regulator [Alphaproteobacteria bacterium]|nr:LysR family transcriptional regulator [Alphaproteobacteria bacterium]
MPGRYTRLPSLAALRSFEAAARHASFSAAAEELGITPSAVSHQIRTLEESLGAKLFVRLNPGMTLTQDGRLLLKGVEAGFLRLVEATDQVKTRSSRRILTVCAPTPVASFWLLPRMPVFAERFPHLEPHVVSFDTGEPSFARDQLDLAILKRHLDRFGLQRNEALLMRDAVFPVCSPSLPTNERPLSEPYHLAAHVLIQEDQLTSPDIDWAVWLKRLGVDASPPRLFRVSHFAMSIQAAIDGHGVAFGRSPLVDRELADGRLVRPLGDLSIGASRAYVVRWPEAAANDAETMALRDFLLAEATGAGVAVG